MKSFLRRRVILGAPLSLVAVTGLAAVFLVGLEVLTHGHPSATTTSVVAVDAAARAVMFSAAALVMRWRVLTAGPETPVWRWLARAGTVAACASILAGGFDVATAHGSSILPGLGAAVLNLGVLTACPLLYQGLIRWNRHGTLTTEPGDWLNGLGAVFALTAIGNLALLGLGSPLLQWHVWDLQLWLLRVGAEVMLVGTAATVLVIGGLLRDPRAWAVTTAIILAAGLDVASIDNASSAAGGGALSSLGYAALAVVLATSAQVREAAPLPRPSTSEAPTAGSFIVLLVSLAVLAGTGLLTHTRTSPTWWATAWATAAAVGVAVRGLHSISLLAHLLLTRHEAHTDDLTGLANRRALDRKLIENLAGDRPFTLMVIDLDGFKQINDRFGHAVGDELLRRAGSLLQLLAPAPAFAARLGGDEFAVVLPGRSLPAATAVFTALARATDDPLLIDGRRLLVRGSVGVATAEPGETPEQVLRNADAAMYRAKTGGGAQLAVHDDAAAHATARRALLVEELKALLHSRDARDDLDTGHLVTFYQPQLSRAGRVVGVEALVRWDNPRLGLLAPDAFLDHVEDYGLMYALTAEVMHQAVHQGARWNHTGRTLRISVNLSATSLTHPDLPTLVERLLAESGLDPSGLVLEITETAIMLQPEQSIARLRYLAERGIGISIDDYGSGYSSLAYLNDLPASELKLDRSLTQHVTANPRTAEIVAGTVSLAHRLGLRVIAEGVEDTTTLDALRELGCDETQGFLHARPMSAEAVDAWFTTGTPAEAALPSR